MIKLYTFLKFYLLLLLALFIAVVLVAQESRQLTLEKPAAVADLLTEKGAALLNAKWFYRDATILDKKFKLPGSQKGGDVLLLYPTGPATSTHTIYPQINAPDFQDGFNSVPASKLQERKGNGHLSFVWYKVDLITPAKIGFTNTKGCTMVFEITVDDYSEVWVNGKQSIVPGQQGNGAIAGYNSRNRVILSTNAQPGEKFSIAILGINGTLGHLPDNYIWIRSAFVDFYDKGLPVQKEWQDKGQIQVIDPSLRGIIESGSRVKKVADGFSFTEGPVWHPGGYLLFSDPNTNTIYRYEPVNHNVSVYISHSGYTGEDIGIYRQPGSNGLTIDNEGRLIVAQHGNRRIIRHEKKGPLTVLADNYQGKKFNSPNDVVRKSDGSIYFTDPPYGLPGFYEDKNKELDFQGIYRIKDGKVSLLSTDLGGPNGIAFSPNEKYLYVTNWDIRDIHRTKTLWRYEVAEDGSLRNGKIFFDWNIIEDEEALDGIKVDRDGNLFVSAPGGLWILNQEGVLLGKITLSERPSNMAWGDPDGKSLYITAHTGIYQLTTKTGGKFSWE